MLAQSCMAARFGLGGSRVDSERPEACGLATRSDATSGLAACDGHKVHVFSPRLIASTAHHEISRPPISSAQHQAQSALPAPDHARSHNFDKNTLRETCKTDWTAGISSSRSEPCRCKKKQPGDTEAGGHLRRDCTTFPPPANKDGAGKQTQKPKEDQAPVQHQSSCIREATGRPGAY